MDVRLTLSHDLWGKFWNELDSLDVFLELLDFGSSENDA